MRKNKQRRNEPELLALGEVLRRRRIELEFTQEGIAGAAELHRTYITDVENGIRNLSVLTLIRLAKALRCPLSSILIEAEELLAESGKRLDKIDSQDN